MDFNNALDCAHYVYITESLVSLLGFDQFFKYVAQQEGFLSEMWL